MPLNFEKESFNLKIENHLASFRDKGLCAFKFEDFKLDEREEMVIEPVQESLFSSHTLVHNQI